MENSILEVWGMVYPSLADCIIMALCIGMFFWFRSSVRDAIAQFTSTLDVNAKAVKEHLDDYNTAHEKSWATLAKLVDELKIGKVWESEYNEKIRHLEAMGEIRDRLIEKLEARLLVIERSRRNGDYKREG